jgi:hypothetical protein
MRTDRKQLVGLPTEDPQRVLPKAQLVVDPRPPTRMVGGHFELLQRIAAAPSPSPGAQRAGAHRRRFAALDGAL